MAWLNGKKVTALWSNDEESNAWGWIDGAWRNSLTGSKIDAAVVGWRGR